MTRTDVERKVGQHALSVSVSTLAIMCKYIRLVFLHVSNVLAIFTVTKCAGLRQSGTPSRTPSQHTPIRALISFLLLEDTFVATL